MTQHFKDTLYSQPLKPIENFVFDRRVADVFDDMIRRSVPGYDAIISMMEVVGRKYARDKSRCYDLGCSLGASTMSLLKGIGPKACPVTAVDNSPAMIEQLKRSLGKCCARDKVEVLCRDIRDVEITGASVVILNFTLQFIEPKARLGLIERIHRGMITGGALIISDKILFEDEQENEFQARKHTEWKKLNGYSDLEIAQKRAALEDVLVPDTLGVHKERLAKAGFREVHVWFQCFNFVSMIAVK